MAGAGRSWQGKSVMRALCRLALVVATLNIAAARADDYRQVQPLLDTTTSNLGQTLVYPDQGAAKIRSLIVTLEPGEETGWHSHPVLTYGYILSGEVTVDYGAAGTKVYRAGDSFMEAFDVPHNGRNSGATPLSILAVFMGSTDLPDVVKSER